MQSRLHKTVLILILILLDKFAIVEKQKEIQETVIIQLMQSQISIANKTFQQIDNLYLLLQTLWKQEIEDIRTMIFQQNKRMNDWKKLRKKWDQVKNKSCLTIHAFYKYVQPKWKFLEASWNQLKKETKILKESFRKIMNDQKLTFLKNIQAKINRDYLNAFQLLEDMKSKNCLVEININQSQTVIQQMLMFLWKKLGKPFRQQQIKIVLQQIETKNNKIQKLKKNWQDHKIKLKLFQQKWYNISKIISESLLQFNEMQIKWKNINQKYLQFNDEFTEIFEKQELDPNIINVWIEIVKVKINLQNTWQKWQIIYEKLNEISDTVGLIKWTSRKLLYSNISFSQIQSTLKYNQQIIDSIQNWKQKKIDWIQIQQICEQVISRQNYLRSQFCQFNEIKTQIYCLVPSLIPFAGNVCHIIMGNYIEGGLFLSLDFLSAGMARVAVRSARKITLFTKMTMKGKKIIRYINSIKDKYSHLKLLYKISTKLKYLSLAQSWKSVIKRVIDLCENLNKLKC